MHVYLCIRRVCRCSYHRSKRSHAWIGTEYRGEERVGYLCIDHAIARAAVICASTKKKEAPTAPSGPSDNDLLLEIRDLLKK